MRCSRCRCYYIKWETPKGNADLRSETPTAGTRVPTADASSNRCTSASCLTLLVVYQLVRPCSRSPARSPSPALLELPSCRPPSRDTNCRQGQMTTHNGSRPRPESTPLAACGIVEPCPPDRTSSSPPRQTGQQGLTPLPSQPSSTTVASAQSTPVRIADVGPTTIAP